MSSDNILLRQILLAVPGVQETFTAGQQILSEVTARSILEVIDKDNFKVPEPTYIGPLYTHEWEFQLESEYIHVQSTMQFFIWLLPIFAVVAAVLKWIMLDLYSAETNVYFPELFSDGVEYFRDQKKHIPGLDNNLPDGQKVNSPGQKKGNGQGKGGGGGGGRDSDDDDDHDQQQKKKQQKKYEEDDDQDDVQYNPQVHKKNAEEKIENINFDDDVDQVDDISHREQKKQEAPQFYDPKPEQLQQIKEEKEHDAEEKERQVHHQQQDSLAALEQKTNEKNNDDQEGKKKSSKKLSNILHKKPQNAGSKTETNQQTRTDLVDTANVHLQRTAEEEALELKRKPFRLVVTIIDDILEKYLVTWAIYFFLFINIGSYGWTAFIFFTGMLIMVPFNILGILDEKTKGYSQIIYHVVILTQYITYFIVNHEMQAAGTDDYKWTFVNLPAFSSSS